MLNSRPAHAERAAQCLQERVPYLRGAERGARLHQEGRPQAQALLLPGRQRLPVLQAPPEPRLQQTEGESPLLSALANMPSRVPGHPGARVHLRRAPAADGG